MGPPHLGQGSKNQEERETPLRLQDGMRSDELKPWAGGEECSRALYTNVLRRGSCLTGTAEPQWKAENQSDSESESLFGCIRAGSAQVFPAVT